MANRVQHGDYWIEPTPRQLRDTDDWTVEGRIGRDLHGQVRVQLFNARDTFPTRDEAAAATVQLGRGLIDGRVEGRAVLF